MRDLSVRGVDTGEALRALTTLGDQGLALFDANWQDLGTQLTAALRPPTRGRDSGA